MSDSVIITLTENGTHFTTPGAGGSTAQTAAKACARGAPVWVCAFEQACAGISIEHRTTQARRANGQIKRMNHMIEAATVARFQSGDHNHLAQYLANFICARNAGPGLKEVKGC